MSRSNDLIASFWIWIRLRTSVSQSTRGLIFTGRHTTERRKTRNLSGVGRKSSRLRTMNITKNWTCSRIWVQAWAVRKRNFNSNLRWSRKWKIERRLRTNAQNPLRKTTLWMELAWRSWKSGVRPRRRRHRANLQQNQSANRLVIKFSPTQRKDHKTQ